MSTTDFLKPRLIGDRFKGHAIPLEFLKDLAVLEEMVIEVAKWRFLAANPNRRRSPRGFTQGIALGLTGVEDGSAIAAIGLFIAAKTLFPLENRAYFEEARDAIVSAIGAAEQNESVTDHLPEKVLSYFDRMGRSLRDGEAMEFVSPSHPTPARLTKETRRRLVLASSKVNELTEEALVRGLVPEADQADMSFEIQLANGQKIPAPISPPHMETIVEAWNGYSQGLRVLVQGIGKFTRNSRLKSFESIGHISILDTLDVAARLEELQSLEDGWLDGEGIALTKEGLEWLTRSFEERYPDDLPLPFLYPTAGGGIQAEWSLEPHELSVEIDLTKRIGEWHALNMKTTAEETRSLNLEISEDWDWLTARVRESTGGAA